VTKVVIKVKQTASPIRRPHRQRATLIGLGLNRIGRVAEVPDTPASRGMIAKVKHLVRVVHEPGIIRGRGYLRGVQDLENIVLKAEDGTPVKFKDVARVETDLTSGAD